MDWSELIRAVGGTGVIIAAIGGIFALFGKILANGIENRLKAKSDEQLEHLKHQFSEEHERSKVRLQREEREHDRRLQRKEREHDRRLQRKEREYDTWLQRAARENEIRFSKLHEQRASVVQQLYSLLYKTWVEMELFTLRLRMKLEQKGNDNSEQDLEAHATQLAERIRHLRDFSIDNKLLFGESLSSDIGALIGTLQEPVHYYGLYNIDRDKYGGRLIEAVENMSEKRKALSDLFGAVEDEFKVILGSKESNKNTSKSTLA